MLLRRYDASCFLDAEGDGPVCLTNIEVRAVGAGQLVDTISSFRICFGWRVAEHALKRGGCSERRFNIVTGEGLLQIFSEVFIIRQDYPQGGVRLFIRTGSFRFANGATRLVHDENDCGWEDKPLPRKVFFRNSSSGCRCLGEHRV